MENNWEQVKDIFQSALDRPAAERESFLAEACRGNQTLSDEVRGLLDSFEEDDSFFERKAIGEVADLIVGDDRRLKPEAQLGRYKIKYQLGAGGMGEVFLAEDTELERLAAVKILSPVYAGDKERIRRFIREAKSASALNHPNILTVYEIGESDGLHFIATEYIDGETLRERLKTEPLNLREILDISIETATALAAAHEAKIIHRDIKPENIMIREDGLVKVLDFGLAKLLERRGEEEARRGVEEKRRRGDYESLPLGSSSPLLFHSSSLLLSSTTPGLIMGTAAYMSPEQARGQAIDARTDIWSFGVCLYEMIAGRKPFAGNTMSDTIAAILTSEPAPLAANVPRKLRVLVQKTLEKNVADRYQTVRELLDELKFLRQNLDAAAETEIFAKDETFGGGEKLFVGDFPVVHPTDENRFDTVPEKIVKSSAKKDFDWKLPAFAATVVLSVCAAITGFYYSPAFHRQNSSSFETMRFARITSTGNVGGDQIAVSPDGKQTAFVIEEGGKQGIWMKQTAGSPEVELIPAAKLEYGGLIYSKDGKYVYYRAKREDKTSALYRVAVAGGEVQKLVDDVETPISFSPDGGRLSFIQKSVNLMTANADGGDLKQLATASEGKKWLQTAWSPDDKTIVCATVSSADGNKYLSEISIENGVETPLGEAAWKTISGIEWLPDRSGLIISGRDLETQLSQIWMIGYPDGKPRRITNDLSSYFGINLTADGKSIVSLQQERKSGIWLASEANAEPARQATFDQDKNEGLSGVALSADGRIVYTTMIGATHDLWISNADGSGKRQLTANTRSNFTPAISPDNRYIAFISTRLGSSDVWRMDLDGGNPQQLTKKTGSVGVPVFSPDGKWVIFQYLNAENLTTIWKVGVDGGEPVQLTDYYTARPSISPDGKFIACYYGNPAENRKTKIAVVPFSGGKPVKLLEITALTGAGLIRWTADGKGLIYIAKDGQSENLWKYPLNNEPPEILTNFKSEKIYFFDALNGKLAVSRGVETSDAIMINDFR